MSPEVGSSVIAIARTLIGSHYINGGYGATPGAADGCPCRPGMINLVADLTRLDPKRTTHANRNLAVLAAEMQIKDYCVCAGNYAVLPPKDCSPTDADLLAYLDSLKDQSPGTWPTYDNNLTPRRAFGPGPGGGQGGKLVWGQCCRGIRHFDCVGFISYCYWKATGNVVQLDISAWRKPNLVGAVFNFSPETNKDGTIRPASRPSSLLDGDILVKADHHIGFVDAGGTIFEAQDTHLGVRSTPGFSLGTPGTWTHLVRLGDATVTPAPEWPLGWWKVWDGNTWYYFFGDDGVVKSSKTTPHNTRTAPAHAHNMGRYTITPPNTLVVTWNQVAGAPTSCVETFYNAKADCEQMNANSNLYSPLVATRMI
jgi:hypothetical protein